MFGAKVSRGMGRAAKPLFWALAVGGFGALCLAAGTYELVQTREWLATTSPATAVVEERHPYTDDVDPLYEAMVVFITSDGGEASARVRQKDLFWFEDTLEVGSTVSIRYDPTAPELAGLSSWDELWGDVAVVLGFGAICTAISVALFVAAGRAMRRPEHPAGILPCAPGLERNLPPP